MRFKLAFGDYWFLDKEMVLRKNNKHSYVLDIICHEYMGIENLKK